MEWSYGIASLPGLERIWEKNIENNKGDEDWVRWRKEYIDYHTSGLILWRNRKIYWRMIDMQMRVSLDFHGTVKLRWTDKKLMGSCWTYRVMLN